MKTSEYSVVGISSPSPATEGNDQHEEYAYEKTSCLPRGWRRTILAGSLAVASVLIINVVFLVWTIAKFPDQGGATIIHSGSCDKVKAIMTWSHLGINVLGTVLLAASNSCMQVLVAPTRAEIDAAHHRNKWLDIGTQTLRNMKFINRKKIALWAIVGLSSVPLHLLYNSVIIASTASNRFNVHTVTNEFLDSTPWNFSDTKRPTVWLEVECGHDKPDTLFYNVHDIQQEARSLPYARLQPDECIKTYARSQGRYGNVLLVTNETADISLLRWLVDRGGPDVFVNQWPCDGIDYDSSFMLRPCNVEKVLTDIRANGWRSPGYQHSELREPPNDPDCPMREKESNGDHMFVIDHCLAQPTDPPCSLYVAVPLLALVVGCNLLKLASLLITFWYLKDSPILTIGDAIDSFLTETDETTADTGIISARNIGRWTRRHDEHAQSSSGQSWKRKSRSGLAAVSAVRWIVINVGFVAAIVITYWLLEMGIDHIRLGGYDVSLNGLVSLGLGKSINQGAIGLEFNQSLAENILNCALLANTPQLIVSILYLAYNDLFTRMAMAREWASFYRKDGRKQPLRVSEPRGLQRSTSFLQMPFWWSVPIIAMMTCLHWLISQSIFFFMEEVFDYGRKNGSRIQSDIPVQAVGFSPIGIIASLGVGVFMVLVLWISAGIIRLRGEMPVVRSCSAAISAACHRPSWDDDAASKLLSWGI